MRKFRIHSRHNEPEAGDVEARLADLRDAMYRASLAQQDPAAQRVFLNALFTDADMPTACFMAVVEARDLPS